MKPRRWFAILSVLLFAFVFSGRGCGPFFDEAIFVQETKPDIAYAAYAGGKLGVPRPGYRVQDLVVAYDWLNGSPLSASEQQQAVHLDKIRTAEHSMDAEDESPAPGMQAWLVARRASGVPGAPPVPDKNAISSIPIEVDRAAPGGSYESYQNCLDDAFATAARTWAARKSAHPADTAALTDWITGQDAVFRNCSKDSPAPAAASANAPGWLRKDRAYQLAATLFYQGDFNQAIAQFRAIAADTGSPWHPIARLIIARAQIRRALLSQITDLPADARGTRDAYSAKRDAEERAFDAALKKVRPQRLAEARDSLRAILADPELAELHPDAGKLLDLVQLQLAPEEQARTLVARLTATDRTQTPGSFEQAMIDLRFYLYPPDAQDSAATKTRTLPALPLLDWIRALQSQISSAYDADASDSDAAQPPLDSSAGAAQSLAAWKRTRSDAWLIAALTTTGTDAGSANLSQAAAAVPRTSPAWTAATYHRLRLAASAPDTRAELDRLTPEMAHEGSRSTENLFLMLRQASSPTLDAFLQDAGTLPAAIDDGESDPHPPDNKPEASPLCGAAGSQATTLLFESAAAAILNTRMPLTMLAQAAASPALPRNLRFQIAQSTWTRAVLLNQPAIARQMTPLLTGCYPAWKPWLAAYDTAPTPAARQAGALLALMRFASTVPVVRTGMQRPDGFATYSVYRDNWWIQSDPGQSNPGSKGLPASLFGEAMPSSAELPDPPFLSAADRAGAATEIAALKKIPCASDYFATAALDWQKQNPGNPLTPDILGFAERVVRNGCSTEATKELNHRLFTVVQTQYPKSEWAKKYTTWE